jgi:Ca2+-binding RTX toxin-like protein
MFTDLGVQTQVNATDAQNEFLLDTLKGPSGVVFAVYSSNAQFQSDAYGVNFIVRSLDAAGNPTGSEVTLAIPASGFTGGEITSPEVIVLSDGRFVLAYSDELPNPNSFPSQTAVRFQIFSSAGVPSGGIQTVATASSGQGVFLTAVEANPAGGFAVATQNFLGSSGGSIYPVSTAGVIGTPTVLPTPTFFFADLAGFANGLPIAMGSGTVTTPQGSSNGLVVDFPGASPPVSLVLPVSNVPNQSYVVGERVAVVESATSVVIAFERLLFQNSTGPTNPPTVLERSIQIVRFIDNQPATVLNTITVAPGTLDDSVLSDFIRLSDGTFAIALEFFNPATSFPTSELRHLGTNGVQLGASETLNVGGSATGGTRLEQLANGTVVATYTALNPATGADTEVFRETFTVPGPSTVPTAGNDSITGTSGNDLIDGLAGNDSIFGGDGDDTIIGGEGNDLLSGQNGNDTIRFGFGDTASGGAGDDTLILSGPFTTNMDFSGGTGFDTFDASAAGIGLTGVGGMGVVFISTERGLGTAFNDYYRVQDDVSATVGKQFFGNGGNDTLVGGSLNDLLDGGIDADTLVGNAGDDTLNGGAGADSIVGGTGFDMASYAGATATVQVVLYNTAYNTGDAAGDTLTEIEALQGSAFVDVLVGDFGVNAILGGAGDDWIDGTYGGDYLYGEAGSDNLVSRNQADVIDGGADFDYVRYDFADAGLRAYLYDTTQNSGFAAGDTLTSVEGIVGSYQGDDLRGDGGNNAIFGQGGDDFIIGLGEVDYLNGGAGYDLFHFVTVNDGGATGDVIQDFVSGVDRISITGSLFGLGYLGGQGIEYWRFAAGTQATYATSQFIFDAATSKLWYDQDGTGAGAKILLATLQPGATVTSGDFLVL